MAMSPAAFAALAAVAFAAANASEVAFGDPASPAPEWLAPNDPLPESAAFTASLEPEAALRAFEFCAADLSPAAKPEEESGEAAVERGADSGDGLPSGDCRWAVISSATCWRVCACRAAEF